MRLCSAIKPNVPPEAEQKSEASGGTFLVKLGTEPPLHPVMAGLAQAESASMEPDENVPEHHKQDAAGEAENEEDGLAYRLEHGFQHRRRPGRYFTTGSPSSPM